MDLYVDRKGGEGKWSREDHQIIGNPAEWSMRIRQDLPWLSSPPLPTAILRAVSKPEAANNKPITNKVHIYNLKLQWINSLLWHFGKHRKQLQAATATTAAATRTRRKLSSCQVGLRPAGIHWWWDSVPHMVLHLIRSNFSAASVFRTEGSKRSERRLSYIENIKDTTFHSRRSQQSNWMFKKLGYAWRGFFPPPTSKNYQADCSRNLVYMQVFALWGAAIENTHKTQEQAVNWSSQCETTAVSNPTSKDAYEC